VQFLSFPVNTAEKCLGQILMTFSVPETTGAGKVENQDRMSLCCSLNIPKLFGLQFLSFHVSNPEKCFGRIWIAFSDPDNTVTGPEHAKLKTDLR